MPGCFKRTVPLGFLSFAQCDGEEKTIGRFLFNSLAAVCDQLYIITLKLCNIFERL